MIKVTQELSGMDRAHRGFSNVKHQEQNTSWPYFGDFRVVWEVLCMSRTFRLRQTLNWSLFVCFLLFAKLNCLEVVLCPGCCFRLIFYSLNLLSFLFFCFKWKEQGDFGFFFFFVRVIFWSGKFISNCKFQRLKTAAKNNSCLDCHKKELFVVFFMLLFKAVKLICNKL